MSSNFAFRGYTRRVARAVVDAMVPRWADFEADLTDDVLDQVEDFTRNYPPVIRLGVVAMLYGLEFSGPLVLDGLKPTSMLDREAAIARLEKVADHRIPQVRMMVMLPKIMVSFSAYSRPEVETFLGAPRRAWRANRKAFRDRLVQIDARRGADPATPEPLVDAGVRPEDYLRFEPTPA